MIMDREEITRSSGNVFADLGFEDAAERLDRADLAIAICRAMRERGLNQTEAARVIGIAQPKVSDIVRGKLDSFSMDRLVRYLDALGKEVLIAVRDKSQSGRCARPNAQDGACRAANVAGSRHTK